MKDRALVAGAGGSIGLAIGRALRARGYRVVATSRSRERLEQETRGEDFDLVEIDFALPNSRERLSELGDVDVLVYNAGRIDLAPLAETSDAMLVASLETHVLGAFRCAQILAPAMVARGRGTFVFIGATASLRGSARTHAFAAGKHALRGLSSSLAKELGPKGVHVAHLVIDGKVWGPKTLERFPNVTQAECLEPAAVASAVLFLIEQPRSAWTWEMDLRPFCERWP